jgi:hypothetical protein
MITEAQWVAYFSGAMTGAERVAFETQLARDPQALADLVEQERIDTALQMLHGPAFDRESVKSSIVLVVSGGSREGLKQGVMREVGKIASDTERLAKSQTQPAWWSRFPFRLALAASFLMGAVCVWHLATRPGPEPPMLVQNEAGPRSAAFQRDPLQWPFASNSPWNTAIGANAEFDAIDSDGFDLGTGAMVVNAADFHPTLRGQETDPLVRVLVRDSGALFASVRVPMSEFRALRNTWNVHVISDDAPRIYQLVDPRWRADGALDILRGTTADLRGSGVPPEWTSATLSGLTDLGGIIRTQELAGGIPHVLGVVIPVEAICKRPNGQAHIWPAAWTPNNPGWNERFAPSGNIHFGSLLAIPSSVDLKSLGLGPSGPAYEIARALQDYGVYVKGAYNAELFPLRDRAGRPHLVFCAELGQSEMLPRDEQRKLSLAVRHLKVVSNNRPTTVGGGGERRRLPAPNF